VRYRQHLILLDKCRAFLCFWVIDEVENEKTYELLYTKHNPRRMVAMKVDITVVI